MLMMSPDFGPLIFTAVGGSMGLGSERQSSSPANVVC